MGVKWVNITSFLPYFINLHTITGITGIRYEDSDEVVK